MVEIFCKIDDRHGQLEEHEYFEVRSIDLGKNAKPCFLIREIHSRWSDSLEQVIWDDCGDDNCRTREEAQRCYDSRRAIILAEGFTSTATKLERASLTNLQAVFSKTTDPNVPLHEQEYFELRLDDFGTPFRAISTVWESGPMSSLANSSIVASSNPGELAISTERVPRCSTFIGAGSAPGSAKTSGTNVAAV